MSQYFLHSVNLTSVQYTGAGLSNVHSVHVHMRSPPHWRPHHQTNVKIVMLKFVIEVWLKCIEITTSKKSSDFTVKMWNPHQNSAHSTEID